MSDKAINIIAGILLAALVGGVIYFGIKDTKPKMVSDTNPAMESFENLKSTYYDEIMPNLYHNVIEVMDTIKTKEIAKMYQNRADAGMLMFLNRSCGVYMSLCNLGEQYYRDDEVVKQVYTLTKEIITVQLGTMKKYCSPNSFSICQKIIDDELTRLHHLGDVLEKDVMTSYQKTINKK